MTRGMKGLGPAILRRWFLKRLLSPRGCLSVGGEPLSGGASGHELVKLHDPHHQGTIHVGSDRPGQGWESVGQDWRMVEEGCERVAKNWHRAKERKSGSGLGEGCKGLEWSGGGLQEGGIWLKRAGRGLGEGLEMLGEGSKGLEEGWDMVGRGWERARRECNGLHRAWERAKRG